MIKLYNIDHFRLEDTLLCGQCFRWKKDKDGIFYGVVGNRAAKMYYSDEKTVFLESSDPDLIFWSRYLNFSTDYNAVEEYLRKDENMKKCMAVGNGIRILRQDLWETLVSFIISANNNIPRIQMIIERLCTLFGDKISFDGKTFYGFPSASVLSSLEVSDLAPIKAGFRDKYILDAARKVVSGEINPEKIKVMSDTDAKKELMKIKGVGTKVADCILLFALGRYKTFPKDVWIKRIMEEDYGVSEKEIDLFAADKFGDYAGIAQQYLYYSHAIKKTS